MFLYQVVSSCSCQSTGTWDIPPTHIAESQLCSADFYMLIRILTILNQIHICLRENRKGAKINRYALLQCVHAVPVAS